MLIYYESVEKSTLEEHILSKLSLRFERDSNILDNHFDDEETLNETEKKQRIESMI